MHKAGNDQACGSPNTLTPAVSTASGNPTYDPGAGLSGCLRTLAQWECGFFSDWVFR